MSDRSSRNLDTFDNPSKSACRKSNLRVVREAAILLWEDGLRDRLRCDWCELMGATGVLTLEMLERADVLPPGGFVGIDLDRARVDDFRQQRPDLKWLAGNLYELLDREELANVGVLNLDEYGEVGNADALVDFNFIRGLVKRGLNKFGEFALFWNQDLGCRVSSGEGPWKGASPACRHGLQSADGLLAAPRLDIRHAIARRKRTAN